MYHRFVYGLRCVFAHGEATAQLNASLDSLNFTESDFTMVSDQREVRSEDTKKGNVPEMKLPHRSFMNILNRVKKFR